MLRPYLETPKTGIETGFITQIFAEIQKSNINPVFYPNICPVGAKHEA